MHEPTHYRISSFMREIYEYRRPNLGPYYRRSPNIRGRGYRSMNIAYTGLFCVNLNERLPGFSRVFDGRSDDRSKVTFQTLDFPNGFRSTNRDHFVMNVPSGPTLKLRLCIHLRTHGGFSRSFHEKNRMGVSSLFAA